VTLGSLVKTWSGHAVRHLPDTPGLKLDVYDFSYCGRSAENRWNMAGSPTLYLAEGKKVALAEYARHFEDSRTPSLAGLTYRRKIFRFKVELEDVLDLRTASAWDRLSLTGAPDCFKDIAVARATANFIRKTTTAQAILVPSMAFLDDLDRWCLVLFLEKLPADPTEFLPSVRPAGVFAYTDERGH